MIEEKVTIHHGKLKRIPVILQFGPVARVDVAVSSAVCYVTYVHGSPGVCYQGWEKSPLEPDSRNLAKPCCSRAREHRQTCYVPSAKKSPAGWLDSFDIPSIDHHMAKKKTKGETKL